MPTSPALWAGVVAAVRHRIIDAQLHAEADNFRFRQMLQRCANREVRARRTQSRGLLERRGEVWPTVGIPAEIHRVYADEHVVALEHLGPRERIAEEDRVPR